MNKQSEPSPFFPETPGPLVFIKHADRVELVDTAGAIIETLTLEEFAERQKEGMK